MISPEYFGMTADHLYHPADRGFARAMDPAQGIQLASASGIVAVRPYYPLYVEKGVAAVIAYSDESGHDIMSFSFDRLAGVHFMDDASEESGAPMPVVSFEYYKPGEVDERVVALRGFGFGVHPGHRTTGINGGMETPTWYMYGRHIGSRTAGTHDVRLLAPDDQQIKHFSMARFVDGPLGDPSSDAAFRERMRIPEIVRA